MAATVKDANGIVLVCRGCGERNLVPYGGLGRATACSGCQAEISAVSAPIDVKTVREFDELVAASPVPILVDFWAPWCGPCRMVAPEMVKVAAARAGRLVVVKVNTEEVPELSERYGIYSVPTMALFSDGSPVAGTAGARPAKAIEAFVDEAMRTPKQ